MALKTCLRAYTRSPFLTVKLQRFVNNIRMCVTWFMINENPEVNGYKLVLAFNRDEFFNRPANPAEFLDDVLCGVDMTPGKEGGTWLGVSKTGRVACLLNIREKGNPERKGRGSLVKHFLEGDTDGCSYMKQLRGSDYNGFNLVTMDFSHAKPDVCYYSNRSENEPMKLKPGFYGISNTVLSQPWPKAEQGREHLEKLMNDNPTIAPDELTDRLILFSSKKEGLSALPTGFSHEEISTILPNIVFVDSPVYGTRSTTVILIDSTGRVTFTEKTRIDPMDSSKTNWSTKTQVFNMKSSV